MKRRRPRCSRSGRKIRKIDKIHKKRATTPLGHAITVIICETCLG